jgi:outer membrane protein assembly factor BamB
MASASKNFYRLIPMKKQNFYPAQWRLQMLVCLGLTGLSLIDTQASEWREFRGPDLNGVLKSEQSASSIKKADKIIWQAPLAGRGLSSPILVSDGVFLTTSEGPKQNELAVWRFDDATGELVWKRRFWATGRTMCHEKTSVAAPTPASDGERIVALYSSNDLICLDLNGQVKWIRGLTQDYPNASNSLGMSSSPIFVDGVLVVQIENDSQSLALGIDPSNGQNIWSLDRPKAANWTSPIRIPQPETDRHWIGLQSSKGITLVEPQTGKVVWRFRDGASTIPSSAWSGNTLYTPSNGITAIQLPKNPSEQEPEITWNSSRMRPATSSPIIVEDHIFTLNSAGVLSCGEALSGERLWQLRLQGPFSGSPVALGSTMFFVNETGVAQTIQLNGSEEATILSELNLGETVLCTPALSQKALYVRSDSTLWKLGSR